MTTRCALLLTAVLGLLSCASEQSGPSADSTDLPPPPDLTNLMQAKLVYSQEIVSGMATSDFIRIRTNAEKLRTLSLQAEWLVHDTQTYVTYSEDFRTYVGRIADHARLRDLDGVTAQYRAMLDTCIRCHTYLREERFRSDLPGDIGQREIEEIMAALARRDRRR